MLDARQLIVLFGVVFQWAIPALAESRYVRQQPDNRQVIVFVHGVTGDSRETWTNFASRTYWPELLTQEDRKSTRLNSSHSS